MKLESDIKKFYNKLMKKSLKKNLNKDDFEYVILNI